MFLSLGVKSVTMDEIAGEMGISKKTIYTHYSTKSKLIEATALFVFQKIVSGIEAIKKNQEDSLQQLFEIKTFTAQHLNNEKSSPQHQLQKYYPKIYSTIKGKQQQLLEELMEDNLKSGISAGIYRKDLPVTFISRMYFIGMLGIKDRDVFPEPEITTSELTDQHLEYHLRAIATPKGLEKLEQLLTSNTQK